MTRTSLLSGGLLLGLLSLSTAAFAQSATPLYATTADRCTGGEGSASELAIYADTLVSGPRSPVCRAVNGAFTTQARSTATLRCTGAGEDYSVRFSVVRSGGDVFLTDDENNQLPLVACPQPRAAAAAPAATASASAGTRPGRRRGGRIAGALARAIPKLLTGDRSDILGTVTGAVTDAVAEAGPGRAAAVVGAVAGAVGAVADGRHVDAIHAAAGAVPGRAGAVVSAVTDAATAAADGRTVDAVSAVASAVAAPRTGAASAAPRAAAGTNVFEQTGSLEHGMPEFDDGSYYDEYAIEVVKGTRYTFQLISEDFDAYLLVEGPSLDLENDDANDSTMDAAISFVAPESGEYLVTVTSYDGGETGDYVLRARF